MELKRRLENGMLSSSISAEMANHVGGTGSGGGVGQSTGRMCQDNSETTLPTAASLHKIDSKSSIARNVSSSPSVMSLSSPFSASITQLPPPEFADFPSDQSQQLPVGSVSASAAATSAATLSGSNGRASMISSSFRPTTSAANSSCSTLPRNLPSSYHNEHPMTSSALLSSQHQQHQQQLQRCSSLKKKTNMKRVSSPIGSAVDELRV